MIWLTYEKHRNNKLTKYCSKKYECKTNKAMAMYRWTKWTGRTWRCLSHWMLPSVMNTAREILLHNRYNKLRSCTAQFIIWLLQLLCFNCPSCPQCYSTMASVGKENLLDNCSKMSFLSPNQQHQSNSKHQLELGKSLTWFIMHQMPHLSCGLSKHHYLFHVPEIRKTMNNHVDISMGSK